MEKNRYWEFFILILSLYVIAELGVEVIYPLSSRVIEMINALELVIRFLFF